MRKILAVLICICFSLANIPTVGEAQSSSLFVLGVKFSPPSFVLPSNFHIPENNPFIGFSHEASIAPSQNYIDSPLINFLKFNTSPITHLPYSFFIPEKDQAVVYQHMDSEGPVKGAIERIITHEGMDIYDGAVYQIALGLAGGEDNLKQASLADDYYWQGSVGETWNVRAGYPINTFIYDPHNPETVSSDIDRFGQRGFIFRIIDADGKYLTTDPLDGKEKLAGFPDDDRLHWVDWKPVAGENAWVVIAAMQLYSRHHDNVELKLSRELARCAIILQSDIGGIRMAPLGAHRTLNQDEIQDFSDTNWWYGHISTENNISWYAAFRMLYQITGEIQYKRAMDGIEKYLRFVWDKNMGIFHQGAYYKGGQWVRSQETFALDVQTWGIACIGPKNLDAWFGQGSAWRIWQAGRAHSGVFDKQGNILGVGYTDEHNRITVEWSAGAMVALTELAKYYETKNPHRAFKALSDKISIRTSMENLHFNISQSLAAYSYSSCRGKIPFGWNSHDPQVMSVASTGWMIFVDAGFNPFWLL